VLAYHQARCDGSPCSSASWKFQEPATSQQSTSSDLLSKKQDVVQVKDFRPISLIHSFAKLVTKLIANWLASKLSAMVSANQSAFVKCHCIHDIFILVQQTTWFLYQQKQP